MTASYHGLPADTARTGGQLLTFYSFKGGVGRSMALANVAALLAKWGKRVLIADWDLEAPGIERYFEPYPATGSRSTHPGILDLLLAYKEGNHAHRRQDSDPVVDVDRVDLGRPVVGHAAHRQFHELALKWTDCVFRVTPFAEAPSIGIISAGRDRPTYAESVQALDWRMLFEDYGIGDYLNQIRQEWKQHYDFVLIDSRTGFSDIGGICTIILPDVLVLFFTTNYQSLTGAAEVMRRARAAQEELPAERERLIAVPVLARDESRTEYEQSIRWRDIIEQHMGEFYGEWITRSVLPKNVLQKLYIPYWAYWSFGERLPVVEREGELADPAKIGAAYGRLALLIANGFNWEAVDRVADPHELQDSRAKIEQLVAHSERTEKSAQTLRLTTRLLALAVAFGSVMVSAYYWMYTNQEERRDEALRTAYNVGEPPVIQENALKYLLQT